MSFTLGPLTLDCPADVLVVVATVQFATTLVVLAWLADLLRRPRYRP